MKEFRSDCLEIYTNTRDAGKSFSIGILKKKSYGKAVFSKNSHQYFGIL